MFNYEDFVTLTQRDDATTVVIQRTGNRYYLIDVGIDGRTSVLAEIQSPTQAAIELLRLTA